MNVARLAACAALAVVAAVPLAARADVSVARGKAVIVQYNCYLCHGSAGQGGAGPTIAPPKLMPSEAQFAAWLRKTGPGTMPVYTAKVISDDDVAAIYAYLSSLKAPTTIPAVLTHP
jgi:mono/diheme cytochrome c family protein